MTKSLLLIYPILSLGLLNSCSQAESHSGSGYEAVAERPKTAAELRAELLEQEQNAPEEYIHTTGTSRRNLIDQLVLEGDIANRASLANFKDPVLSVTWYSKTNTKLGTKQYQIFELIRAHHSIAFKLKTDAPDYVDNVSMGVLEATAVE